MNSFLYGGAPTKRGKLSCRWLNDLDPFSLKATVWSELVHCVEIVRAEVGAVSAHI